MWRKGKRRNEEDRFAGNGESKPPNKLFKKDDVEANGITICDISKNRRVSVRTFQGKVMVDIREFYMKDGKQMPGKKAHSFRLYPYIFLWVTHQQNIARHEKKIWMQLAYS